MFERFRLIHIHTHTQPLVFSPLEGLFCYRINENPKRMENGDENIKEMSVRIQVTQQKKSV